MNCLIYNQAIKQACDQKYGTICDKCGKKKTDYTTNIPSNVSKYETLCSQCFDDEGLDNYSV